MRRRFVDADDHAAVRAAVDSGQNVKALWCESLANPGGVVSDIEALGSIARDAGVPLIVDNTMGAPFGLDPATSGIWRCPAPRALCVAAANPKVPGL